MADLNNNNGPRRPNLLTSSVNVNQSWISTATAPSIFSVEVVVRYEDEDNYESLVKYVEMTKALLPEDKRDKIKVPKKTKVATNKRTDVPEFGGRQQTGFLVHRHDNFIYILTTAHAVDSVYQKGVHQISILDLNVAFSFSIICTHHEEYLKSTQPDMKVSELVRSYSAASVIAIDTQKDLLLLEAEVDQLRLHDVDDDQFVACPFDHPVITMSLSPPAKDELVLMHGWPPHRVNSSVWGNASHNNRTYDVLTRSNVKGYDMRLMEVPQFDCSDGFSGSPILNGDSNCVVVYHAIIKQTKFGYCISLDDVRRFVTTALNNYVSRCN